MKVLREFCLALAVALAAGLMPWLAFADDGAPTVFAAASLKNALDAIGADWKAKTGRAPVLVYAATSSLAKQISQGADADIFISGDQAWMDNVEKQGLSDPKSRTDIVANTLVLIAPKDSDVTTDIAPGFPLAELLGDGRLAVAGVDAVPAGRYAKEALQSLGVWEQVKDRLAQGENVRAALRLVSRAEGPIGIVYGSDAHADPHVRVLGVFPTDSHKPILYPAVRLRGRPSTESDGLFAYLKSPESAARFEQFGFSLPRPTP